jgi:hypothetical protein
MAITPWFAFNRKDIVSGLWRRKSCDGLKQTVFGKRFGQVLVGTDHSSSRPIKKTVLGGEHDQWGIAKTLVFFDQGASLVSIEPWHHDVAKDYFGLVVGNFCQRVKTILGKHHLTSGLYEKNLSTTPDGVAVVNDHHFDATQIRSVGQFLPPQCPSVWSPVRGYDHIGK